MADDINDTKQGETPRPARQGLTAERRELFLAKLAASANVAAAARAAGVAESSVYRSRRRSARFRQQWADALEEGYNRLELMLLERAMNGTRRRVFHGGKAVGSIREYSDGQAISLLKAHWDAVRGGQARPADQSADDPGQPQDRAEIRAAIEARLVEMSERLTGGAKA